MEEDRGDWERGEPRAFEFPTSSVIFRPPPHPLHFYWNDIGYTFNPHCMEAGYDPAVIRVGRWRRIEGIREEESLRPSLPLVSFSGLPPHPPSIFNIMQESVKATACSVERY